MNGTHLADSATPTPGRRRWAVLLKGWVEEQKNELKPWKNNTTEDEDAETNEELMKSWIRNSETEDDRNHDDLPLPTPLAANAQL